MDDLVEFLRARLDEDERTAHAVQWDGSGNTLSWELPFSATVQVGSEVFSAEDSTIAEHIVRHDPARVLREVEAKRRTLGRINSHATIMGWDELHGDLLRLLTLPYSDHPDCREDWRP